MLREIFSLFTSDSPSQEIADDLDRMLRAGADLVRAAGNLAFERTAEPVGLEELKTRDKEINKLQRRIRKQSFGQAIANPGQFSLAFCLSIGNVVKDVERIGDYAKELGELVESTGSLSGSAAEGRDLAVSAASVEAYVSEVADVMSGSDQERAVALIAKGKELRGDLSTMQRSVLTGAEPQPKRAAFCLATQYYGRIVSHSLNVLSTLVTPLHRMDYVSKKHLLPEVREQLKKA